MPAHENTDDPVDEPRNQGSRWWIPVGALLVGGMGGYLASMLIAGCTTCSTGKSPIMLGLLFGAAAAYGAWDAMRARRAR